uniref:Transcription termination factor MTERF9, chloroplastic n=1 Tax=Kalanchoe fedtschenkoi TaxID=63787 RepID=A0A7N0U1V9_KALFE
MALSLSKNTYTLLPPSLSPTCRSHWCAPPPPTRRHPHSSLVFASHSNPRILKSNRKTRHGRTLSPYHDTDDDEIAQQLHQHDDDDDLFSDDDASETDDEESDDCDEEENFTSRKTRDTTKAQLLVNPNKNAIRRVNSRYSSQAFENSTVDGFRSRKLGSIKKAEKRYPLLAEELDMDEKWFPLLDYLSTLGLKESHFLQMYERHMPSLQINVVSAKERIEYLLSIGVKQKDIKRIILRQPQILQYTVENNLKSHVAFLVGLGIPESRVGQIVTAAPSLFSYSVENSLKPTVRYLIEEIGIKKDDMGKVVQLSPQILVQRIDVSWSSRYVFLSKELGAPKDSVMKMVRKHPQLLHYSIEDGLLPRINFLRSIGMRNDDILKVLTSLTQVFSLSLEDNLRPKYKYLIDELHNEVHSLTKYPMYLSLSLDQRIRPRHRFLVSLKKAPKGPFPLSSLVPTDESFCQQWAGTSVDKYLAFRQRLLLKEFAKKYERQ